MIAKYPVEISDGEGIVDAVNYLLSGPSGLGQNFAGFSSYYPEKYLTGNFRIPFTQEEPADLYVPPINITNAEQLDDRTLKYYFATQPSPPFNLGNGLTILDIVPSSYNSRELRNAGNSVQQIGVVECTVDYVIVRTVSPILVPLATYVSGGTIEYNIMDTYNSTDCDVRVTVTGGSDRVFLSAQLEQTLTYTVPIGVQDFYAYVAINRYAAYTNDNPTNPDFLFEGPTTIVEKTYNYSGSFGTNTIDLNTIFTGYIDQPPPGYYRYIVELYFQTFNTPTDVFITEDILKLRSITAQVVKQ